jgi:hypothetical protein
MSVAEISLAVAIAGTSISLSGTGISLFFSRRADRRAKRAEERAERGRPIVIPEMRPAVGEGYVKHPYRVRNAGESLITYVLLWIEDATGETISTGAGGDCALEPGASAIVGGFHSRWVEP